MDDERLEHLRAEAERTEERVEHLRAEAQRLAHELGRLPDGWSAETAEWLAAERFASRRLAAAADWRVNLLRAALPPSAAEFTRDTDPWWETREITERAIGIAEWRGQSFAEQVQDAAASAVSRATEEASDPERSERWTSVYVVSGIAIDSPFGVSILEAAIPVVDTLPPAAHPTAEWVRWKFEGGVEPDNKTVRDDDLGIRSSAKRILREAVAQLRLDDVLAMQGAKLARVPGLTQ